MDVRPLTADDEALLAEAREVALAHYAPDKHWVATVLRAASGNTYAGVNLDPDIGAASVHAEGVALGAAIVAGETDFETVGGVIVDPDRSTRAISSCGVCRELLSSFAPDIDVIIPGDDGPVKVALPELLPAQPYADD